MGGPAGASMPLPYLIRGEIPGVPSRIALKHGDPPAFTLPWKWCYNETGSEPGILTVHIDMKSFAPELSPLPDKDHNSQCQPRTFCKLDGTKKNGSGWALNFNHPMPLANPKLKKN